VGEAARTKAPRLSLSKASADRVLYRRLCFIRRSNSHRGRWRPARNGRGYSIRSRTRRVPSIAGLPCSTILKFGHRSKLERCHGNHLWCFEDPHPGAPRRPSPQGRDERAAAAPSLPTRGRDKRSAALLQATTANANQPTRRPRSRSAFSDRAAHGRRRWCAPDREGARMRQRRAHSSPRRRKRASTAR
jgi:hypothetical protein